MNTFKYVPLIIAMKKNRGDFSDGFNYVKNALLNFEVESKLDQLVYNELQEIVYSGDYQDGRAFRDCMYNYDYLYKNVLDDFDKEFYKELVKEDL